MRHRLGIVIRATIFALVGSAMAGVLGMAGGCSDQSEGDRCTPCSGTNNVDCNGDCASGLTCTPVNALSPGATTPVCCPVDRSQATTPLCSIQSTPTDASTSFPRDGQLDGFQEGATSDVPAEAVSTGSDAAPDVPNAPDASDASTFDAPNG